MLHRSLLLLISLLSSISLAPVPSIAADEPVSVKPVKLAWFPRFSPDSKWLITAHGSWGAKEGGEVRVWNATTGDSQYVVSTDRGIRSVQFAPNGKFFAAGGYGNVALLFDAATGQQTDQIKFPGTVETLQITPDSKWIVTGHGGGAVRITELPSKRRVHEWNQIHKGGIWNARLSRDGKLLATAGRDGFVRVFDLAKLTILYELPHPGETNGLAFSPDDRVLLTGCADAAVRYFSLSDGNQAASFKAHESGSVTDMQFSPDGKLLVTCGLDRSIRLWDLTLFDRPQLVKVVGSHDEPAFGVSISPDGKLLASAGWDSEVKVWDFGTQEEKWTWSR